MLVDQPNSSSRSADGPPAERENHRGERRRKRSTPAFPDGIVRVLGDLAGWYLALLLVAAPWVYGTTLPETRDWLAVALCGLGFLFVVSLVVQRRWPRINPVVFFLGLVILAQGWFMTWNAKLVYDPQVLYFHHILQPISSLPGTVDRVTSWREMLLVSGLLCAFWVTSDLAAIGRWRERLWLVASLTGLSIVLLGLVQRVTAAPGILWRTDLDCGPTFFATYRYHGNAGSFINLVLPLIAAQSIYAFRKALSSLARAFWLLASLCVLASALVNLSRAATVITFCLVAVFSIRQLQEIIRTQRHTFSKWQLVSMAGLVIVAVGTLAWIIGFGDAYKHWVDLGNSIVTNGRFIVYNTIWCHILPKSGAWGFGPATFPLIFPFFTNGLGTRIHGYWAQAHSDYLQTLVEWGFVGTAAWCLFFGSTIIQSALTFWRRKRIWDGRTRIFWFACLLALASVLVHSAVDFPLQIASLQLYATVVLGFLASLEYANPDRNGRVGATSVNRSRYKQEETTGAQRIRKRRSGSKNRVGSNNSIAPENLNGSATTKEAYE